MIEQLTSRYPTTRWKITMNDSPLPSIHPSRERIALRYLAACLISAAWAVSLGYESPAQAAPNGNAAPLNVDQAFQEIAEGGQLNEELFLQALARFRQQLSSSRKKSQAFEDLAAKLKTVSSPVIGPERNRRLNLLQNQLAAFRMVRDSHLAATLPAESLTKHPSADAFPGPVPEDAPRVVETLRLNIKAYGCISTGLYAAPGEKIRITLPEELIDAGLKLRIGPHKAAISLTRHKTLKRFQKVDRVYDLSKPGTICTSAFGGLVYVELPVPKESGLSLTKGDIYGLVDTYVPPEPIYKSIRSEGAVRAPLYLYGQTNLQQWRQEIRQYPAPWAEIGSDRVIFSLPSSFIRNLDDPDRVMEVWNQILDSMADLAGRPRQRPVPARFVLDGHVNWGGAYAGYPIVAPFGWGQAIIDGKAGWGHVHELGHLHQHKTWTFQNTGEVTVNLFSLYSMEKVYQDRTQRRDPQRLAELTRNWMSKPKAERNWLTAGGPWDKLTPYIILIEEFGWEPLKTIFRDCRMLPVAEHPETNEDRAGDFVLRFSKEVGKNLFPYFDEWGVQMSPRHHEQAAELPSWESLFMKELLKQPGPQPGT